MGWPAAAEEDKDEAARWLAEESAARRGGRPAARPRPLRAAGRRPAPLDRAARRGPSTIKPTGGVLHFN